MKLSRIDVIGQNGNDGEHYDGVGREWLIQSGLIASSGEGADRSGQNGLPDQMEMRGTEGRGAESEGPGIALDCACEFASSGCGSVESQGSQIEQKSEAV